MSFECAACHDYLAGVGTDPPQLCSPCKQKDALPTCVTCKGPVEWLNSEVKCLNGCVHVHGEVRDARPAITTSNDVGAPVTFSSPAKLEFTRDLRTRTLVLRAIARHAEALLEQATDMQLREAYEATSGGTDDVAAVEMQRMEQSFKNVYARLLELVTTFPRKT